VIRADVVDRARAPIADHDDLFGASSGCRRSVYSFQGRRSSRFRHRAWRHPVIGILPRQRAQRPICVKLSLDFRRLAHGALTRQYPDDLDAATLYAESAMDLRPWKLYTNGGKPEEGTEEIVMVLQSVLVRDPNHIGANHYYIHATEGSLAPERGMQSASDCRCWLRSAGHLVHMPAHVYMAPW